MSFITIVELQGNSSIEFQHKFKVTEKQLGVILGIVFGLIGILLIFTIILFYKKRQLAKLDNLLNN